MKKPAKRTVYLALTVLLGALLGFLLHTLGLLVFAGGAAGAWTSACRVASVIVGAALGLPVGKAWWRIVYTEKRGGLFQKIR